MCKPASSQFASLPPPTHTVCAQSLEYMRSVSAVLATSFSHCTHTHTHTHARAHTDTDTHTHTDMTPDMTPDICEAADIISWSQYMLVLVLTCMLMHHVRMCTYVDINTCIHACQCYMPHLSGAGGRLGYFECTFTQRIVCDFMYVCIMST